jgi:hypothetical protein
MAGMMQNCIVQLGIACCITAAAAAAAASNHLFSNALLLCLYIKLCPRQGVELSWMSYVDWKVQQLSNSCNHNMLLLVLLLLLRLSA